MTNAIAQGADQTADPTTPQHPAGPGTPSDPWVEAVVLLTAMWPNPELTHQIGTLDRTTGEFKNVPVKGIPEAVELSRRHAQRGLESYFACAEYTRPGSRTAQNVVQARAFWLDIDCGANKASNGQGYLDARTAAEELKAFCRAQALPMPTHWVDSGRGLHAYWALQDPVDRDTWQANALKLKAITQHVGLLADPSRTADIASVLRIPGTRNHKYDPPSPVRLIESPAAPIPTEAFLDAIDSTYHPVAEHLYPRAKNRVNVAPGQVDQGLAPKPDMPKLRAALAMLDPDCDEAEWKLHRIAPMARAAVQYPDLRNDLYAVCREWSSGELGGEPSVKWCTPGTNGLTGSEVFEREWRRFAKAEYTGRPATIGSIFYAARAAGWQPDEFAVMPSPEKKPKGASKRVTSGDALETHNSFALRTLDHLAVGDWSPVAHDGKLFVLEESSSLWAAYDTEDLIREVALLNDGRNNCKKRGDYSGIAQQAISLATRPSFFDAAPVGIACAGDFYRVHEDRTLVEPLRPDHLQRVMLPFKPEAVPTPQFDRFLEETFRSHRAGEEEQQRTLVQEIAGAVLLGVMPRFHKAVLFYEPYGRAGKGTLERIVTRLVPSEFATAVSPFNWGKEYYVATLAGKRLNVVGELPDSESIPAANFKSVLGGDLITGRQPTQRVISFRNEAAHIFTSNHLIATRDQSEAFFARWIIVEFPNSRLLSGLPLDPHLADRIIATELPGIAQWALEGGRRLLKRGCFPESAAHSRLMEKWRRTSNSLDEFIFECCELGADKSERRAKFYGFYKNWCQDNGRKPYSKMTAKELMEHKAGLAVQFVELHGYETIRGIVVREAFREPDTSGWA